MSQPTGSLSCRYCSNGTLRRLHRSPLLRFLLGWLPQRLYECKKCGRKAWRKPSR